jgi:hypothetical protein
MKKLLAPFLCFLSFGCIVGVSLETPEETIQTWIRSYNDRDVEGMYLTLSKSYIFANGGEEQVKEDIEKIFESAREQSLRYTLKSTAQLALPREEDQKVLTDIYLARMDREYRDGGEKVSEEIILNFRIEKEDKKYKIAEYWD